MVDCNDYEYWNIVRQDDPVVVRPNTTTTTTKMEKTEQNEANRGDTRTKAVQHEDKKRDSGKRIIRHNNFKMKGTVSL